jgi:hypothetical protein
MSKESRIVWISVTAFAIAMGLLETIVVVYLRELYYPEGFAFPLKLMKPMMVSIELLRELATLIMLLAVGFIAGKNASTRFAWFIYAFAIWDIFYYVFLRLLVNWPESLFTWDILFLIPVTWVGPVIGPVINSLTMILLAIILIEKSRRAAIRISGFEWMLLILGSIAVILSYTLEYTHFMLDKFSLHELFKPENPQLVVDYATTFIPRHFMWGLFACGVALHGLAIGSIVLRTSQKRRPAG